MLNLFNKVLSYIQFIDNAIGAFIAMESGKDSSNPKNKNPAELSDFRPLSIISIISGLLEKFVVQEYLYPALLNPPDHLIFSDQYAFCPTGSTTAVIIDILDKVTSLLESSHNDGIK